ncbi:MAG: peptidylprolyl isomerase [Prevotella sp.]|jgi:peptidylprolyl isomerase/peptidyl-prolyl cis-trans isomerase B (cyclophilin B)|nr:peptidylprolyl isomerase [Prevotella sp.]
MIRSITALIILLFSLSVCTGKEHDKGTKVLINTDFGKIVVKLYDDTPLHRDNFIKLVNEHKYDGVLFHRVIKQFMIQAGDFSSVNAPAGTKLGTGGASYTIPAEILYPKYFHKSGQLAAARTGDDTNPERASSGSQFYIVTGKHYTDYELDKTEKETGKKFTPEEREAFKTEGGAPHLDGAYTVFGEVVTGMKVVRKIELLETDENDRPKKNIKIKSMKILK